MAYKQQILRSYDSKFKMTENLPQTEMMTRAELAFHALDKDGSG